MRSNDNLIILITGSRDWCPYLLIWILLCLYRPRAIVHGNCKGVDRTADEVAGHIGMSSTPVDAEWDKYGDKAGPIRNKLMIDYISQLAHEGKQILVLAFHQNIESSKGTKGCIKLAESRGLNTILIDGRRPIDVDFIIE